MWNGITAKKRVKIQGKENNERCKIYRKWEVGDQHTGERHTSVQTKGKMGK